jgi:hypothetical protein
MKRTLAILGVVLVLLIAYAAWPLFGLKQIVDSVQQKDVASLSQRIDAAALKRSLVDQIALAYLHVSGKDKGLNQFETRVALAAAAALAGPQVDAMLKPDKLMELLRDGGTDKLGNVGQVMAVPQLQLPNMRNFFRLVRNTEYSGTSFAIVLPLASDENTGYRLRLTLENWTWKLSGVGLPQDVRTRIASEIVRRSDRPT